MSDKIADAIKAANRRADEVYAGDPDTLVSRITPEAWATWDARDEIALVGMTDHTDDPLAHLIAANERLHAEVQRLTDEHVRIVQWADERNRAAIERQGLACSRLVSIEQLRSERDTLRADLATSEQTIAALKAQLRRVKEAAE